MKKRIHVNQHVIKANAKNGTHKPVLTIKTYKGNTYAHSIRIEGPSTLVYRPDRPLSCGARVWLETDSDVVINPDEDHAS